MSARPLARLALLLAVMPACGALGGAPAAPPYVLTQDPAYQQLLDRLGTNESNIDSNRRSINDIPDLGTIESDFATLRQEVTRFDGRIQGNTGRIGDVADELAALEKRVTTAESDLAAHKQEWASFMSSFGQRLRALADLFQSGQP